jgi:uncharacterized protein (DUF1015 family)
MWLAPVAAEAWPPSWAFPAPTRPRSSEQSLGAVENGSPERRSPGWSAPPSACYPGAVPQLLPFRGLRPDTDLTGPLDNVVCPPYDVISEEERLELLARSPYNVVRVELPSGDYEQAANLLRQWAEMGALGREQAPALYAYRMSFTGPDGRERSTLGVLGALVLEAPGQGILPHEHTTPKARTDRLELIRATEANISPIWCLAPTPGLTAAIGAPDGEVARATDDDGVAHELWPITDPERVAAVQAAVSASPVLVADGHHRYETALAYQGERRAAGDPEGGFDQLLTYVVELAEDQLLVQGIHRLLSGLPEGFDLLEVLGRGFELSPTEAADETIEARMLEAGGLAVITPEGTWLAKPTAETVTNAAHDLDSARFDTVLAQLPEHELRYDQPWSRIVAAVASGRAQAGILCRPATVAQIAEIARGGERMTPKTTFFWPKPRTGMVLRDFVG